MQFSLKIVTPNRLFFEGNVDKLSTKGVCGDFEVLPNMAPYVTTLQISRLKLTIDGKEKIAAISGGYIDVRNNNVIVVANACEWYDEIDVERAMRAKERAERRIKENEGDVLRAEIALKKAINRINIKG